jgi:glucose/mannose-6-phosphate isomerase
MKDSLRAYNSQFSFVPEIVNEHLVKKNYRHVVLCGMGGSHLAAGLLKTIQPGVDIYVHRDYDLPPFEKSFLESGLLVASSFSGNTEEVISFYKKAKQLFDLPVLCISMGGELLELARQHNDPYIVLPQTDFVPRTALGLSTIALAYVLKDKETYRKLCAVTVDISKAESDGREYAGKIRDRMPIFYASSTNLSLAYNWKIKCNETGKMHAFCNVFPEANHNELEAYEYAGQLSQMMPVLLLDGSDDSRVQKRFEAFRRILEEKRIEHLIIDISDSNVYRKVFQTLVTGDFCAAELAERRQVPQAEVALIEEFKRRLKN